MLKMQVLPQRSSVRLGPCTPCYFVRTGGDAPSLIFHRDERLRPLAKKPAPSALSALPRRRCVKEALKEAPA
jgi:hypothetical protein